MKRIIIVCLLVFMIAGCATKPSAIDWSWGPVVPKPKTSLGTTSVGDSVVTVGGTFWVTTPDGKDLKIWLAKVYQLDTKEMKWSNLPDYPHPAGYPFVAAIGSKIYVVGGRNADKGNAETFILDTSEKNPKWVQGPSLPRPRWSCVGGVIDEVIYITAGEQGDLSKKGDVAEAASVMALDTKNLQKGWQHVGDIPGSKPGWTSATTCNGKLYIFGGTDVTKGMKKSVIKQGSVRVVENSFIPYQPHSRVLSFDVATGKWEKCTAMPDGKSSCASLAIDDRYILLAGGVDLVTGRHRSGDDRMRLNFSSDCLVYDTIKDNYEAITPLKKAVADVGVVKIGDTLYVIGGENNPFKTRTDLVQIGKLK
ncbi:Kelch repeat-containing protein [Planctomycetota bacterium]